jgi:hypothetical protein
MTFAAARFSGGIWSHPQVTGHTPTSIAVSGLTGFGAFAAGNIALTIADLAVTEGNSGTVNADFMVTLGAPAAAPVSVDAKTTDGTATAAGGDYEPISPPQTLVFDPGDPQTQAVSVQVNGDLTTEQDETFFLDLENLTGARFLDNRGLATILNDDGAPSITIDDVAVTEGNSGSVFATFNVTLSHPTKLVVRVDAETADLTASAAAGDYTPLGPVELTFTPGGPLSQPVSILVHGDVITEADETFALNLSDAQNATIADPQGVGTILNDDAPPALTIDDVAVAEGDSGEVVLATFTVTLSHPSKQIVSVDVETADGTATEASGDYVPLGPQVLTFTPGGPLTRTVSVTVNGDARAEEDETFVLNLSNPEHATIADAQGVGTILDDDDQPSIAINDVVVTEGDFPTVPATFTVTLSNPSKDVVRVQVRTVDGTAKAFLDYQPIDPPETLTFEPGNPLSLEVTVPVLGDVEDEADEVFRVVLSNPENATLADGEGTCLILDNDGSTGIDPAAAPVAATFLGPGFPNPFAHAVTVPLGLHEEGPAVIRIYDAGGRLVRSLLERTLPAGRHQIHWDGRDERGGRVSSGVYILRLTTGKETFTRVLGVLR